MIKIRWKLVFHNGNVWIRLFKTVVSPPLNVNAGNSGHIFLLLILQHKWSKKSWSLMIENKKVKMRKKFIFQFYLNTNFADHLNKWVLSGNTLTCVRFYTISMFCIIFHKKEKIWVLLQLFMIFNKTKSCFGSLKDNIFYMLWVSL